MIGSAVRRHGADNSVMPLTQSCNPLKGGYKNHPCTRWSGESRENFDWLSFHAVSLCYEFSIRFQKEHFCFKGLCVLDKLKNLIPRNSLTCFALAMPDEFKSDNPVDSYRKYYKTKLFAKWEKGREAPYWWN